MRRNLLLPLACSVLLFPLAANAAIDNTQSESVVKSGESIVIAGFLDSIDEIKDTVEGVRDDIDTTNETTTDTIDATHGINEGVGNSRQIVEGGGESNDSTVIEQTQVSETTEEQVAPTDDGASF